MRPLRHKQQWMSTTSGKSNLKTLKQLGVRTYAPRDVKCHRHTRSCHSRSADYARRPQECHCCRRRCAAAAAAAAAAGVAVDQQSIELKLNNGLPPPGTNATLRPMTANLRWPHAHHGDGRTAAWRRDVRVAVSRVSCAMKWNAERGTRADRVQRALLAPGQPCIRNRNETPQ